MSRQDVQQPGLFLRASELCFPAAYATSQNGGVSPSGKGSSLWERWSVALYLLHMSSPALCSLVCSVVLLASVTCSLAS